MSLPYGTIRSIECPECRNDIWETRTWNDENVAECLNCGHERPYYPRTRRTDTVTPSQEKAAAKIRRFFDGSRWGSEPKDLYKFETELSEYGSLFVKVETTDNIYTTDGGFFTISRRGKITMNSSNYLAGSAEMKREHEKSVAEMLGAEWSR